MRTAAELTLGRESDAVPKARRFVLSSLSGEPAAVLHAVGLVVTELVTNALLHGDPPVSIRLIHLGERIRVEVEDTGRNLPVLGLQDGDSMTGRGLALVAGLSSRWGIHPGRQRGKVVWAELGVAPKGSSDGASDETASLPANLPEITPEAVLESRRSHHGEPTFTVRLDGVPTALLLAAKAHIDNVVRELVLLRGGERSGGTALPPAMAALIETVTGDFAEARAEIKRQALAAAARGEAVTNLELQLPLSYAEAGERYLAALDEADRYARSAHLLTLAPPLSHRTFRRWYVGSLIEQLRALGAGRVPEPPEPLPTVLAAGRGRDETEEDEMEQELRETPGA